MRWFYNFSTRTKLLFGFAISMGLFIAAMVINYNNIKEINALQRQAYEKDIQLTNALVELRSEIEHQRARTLEIHIVNSKSEREKLESEILKRDEDIEQIVEQIGREANESPKLSAKLDDLGNLLTDCKSLRQEQMSYIENDSIQASVELSLGRQNELYENIRSVTIDMGGIATMQANNALLETSKQISASINSIYIISFILIVFGVIMIIFLERVIAHPLRQLADASGKIAAGELNVTLPKVERKDEVGVLMKKFRAMTESLQNIASVAIKIAEGDLTVKINPQSEKDVLGNAFEAMVKNLSSITSEIFDAVQVLNISANQILGAASNLASSASQTASAVSETTSTMEEVRHTSSLAKNKAQYVFDTSQKTVEISQSGEEAVDEAKDGMSNIDNQMNAIAESIIKLSEQSQAIGDIITTVNDLTEQSNLLAVNASIEAAKAGEHGKGFAVVAQEVRNLAEQSRQSTNQIRVILNDIQKAMNTAVLATEQGSKAVVEGVNQAQKSGKSIRTIAESIEESMKAASEILGSSQEQMVGLEQISLSMRNINDGMNQNVDSTKQVESAANKLNELGQSLKKLLSKFKV